MEKSLRIVFMGSPDFAVESLKILLQENKNIVGVITAPDKPAGRGQKISKSAVKLFAEEKGLKILQPKNLRSTDFIEELKNLNADLQIVVAFRMLPEIVWKMPRLGSFNLHASLLPKYRGAAPINWAIINGEKESGVSTFFLQHQIDTGAIILQESIPIGDNETAGELHDRLMRLGGKLVLKTLVAIEKEKLQLIKQSDLISGKENIPQAPKIFKEDCKIDWSRSLNSIHNFIRGLSPYPTAWSELTHKESSEKISFKIYQSSKQDSVDRPNVDKATLDSSEKKLKIILPDGTLTIEEIQLAGKRRMLSKELLNGMNMEQFTL